jgi:rhamnosyltransferase
VSEAAGPAARILAAVVTYHPGDDLDANLTALRAQLADVVVIDNASPAFFEVERRATGAGCRFIGNADNLGMPCALNQAAQVALAEGFDWLACFDQDTCVGPGVFATLMAVHDAHPERERIAILSLSHRDRTTGAGYGKAWHTLARGEGWRGVRSTISSGMLVRTQALRRLGAFDGRLFMDWFDHDLCLRARRAGWLVVEGEGAVMAHSIGEMTPLRILGMTRHYSVHSAARNYYIVRDTLEVCRRHMSFDPRYCLSAVVALIGGGPLQAILGPEKLARSAAMLAGARDFALRRFGPRQ